MGPRVARSILAAPALLLALGAGACARKGQPSGGPPDVEPPRLIAASPDSGAQGVPRNVSPTLAFSEGMEPRSTGEAISIAPRIDIKERRWHGRTVALVLAESLAANRTYTLFLGRGARDRHGNLLAGGATVVFTTAATMPPGVLEGAIVARGFPPAGNYVWCYDAARGVTPDSTARDFDDIGLTDHDGRFRVVGLTVPGRYRLWVFVDLNHNHSFEPETDILAPVDSLFALTPEAPVASGFTVPVANPHAVGFVRGAVIDSVGGTSGSLLVVAVAAGDSLRRVTAIADSQRRYELQLRPGSWRVRAWRDLDHSRDWQPALEPASAERRIEVAPASEDNSVDLVLAPPPGGR